MRIVEYRIILPIAFDQCHKASFYAVAKRMTQETNGGDGFEYHDTHDYEEDGRKGHYVERTLHFKRQIPAVLRWSIPDRYAHLHEINTNCYPHTKAVFDIEGMGPDMVLITETMYTPITNTTDPIPDNTVNLSEEDLRIREIVYIDILNGPIFKPDLDIRGFECKEAGISQLTAPDSTYDKNQVPKWVREYPGPLTLVAKVVKFHFRWRGLQTFVENLVATSVWFRVYSDSHRAMVLYSPEWCRMTDEEMADVENRTRAELENAVIDKN